jgi:ankyrin repeat protein
MFPFFVFPFPASPLHICAPKGMLEVTDTLLSKGCSVVAVDSRGFTPILACAPNEDVATCIAMIMQIYFSNPANTESARKSICSIGKHD